MASDDKITYGYVEKALLVDKDMVLSAKLDTGAKSASLSAVDIHEIDKQGKTYLRFKVLGKNEKREFTCEYVGKVKIKVRSGEHIGSAQLAPIKRPVVLIDIQLGKIKRTIRVNLTNRKRFNYPLLLGRDAIIAFNGRVDPEQAFMNKIERS